MRSLALPAVLALSAALGGCVEEDRVVYVRSVPSAEPAELVAVSPGPDHFYVRGHWEWDGTHYVWKASRYIRRPHGHAVWVEGHWQSSERGWFWQPGHWADVTRNKGAHVYAVPATPAPSTVVEQAPPSEQVEEDFASPPGAAETSPKAAVPPAPKFLPPPPPATPPPPGQGTLPQRYVAPTPGTEY